MDSATVISGRSNGVWHYRVRALSKGQVTPWSEAVRVEVTHHSLNRAGLFLLTGAIVFFALAWVIIRADQSER